MSGTHGRSLSMAGAARLSESRPVDNRPVGFARPASAQPQLVAALFGWVLLVALGFAVPRCAAAEAPLLIGTNQTEDSYYGQIFRRIFDEAFRRLGVRAEVVEYPLPRLESLLEHGLIDAEAARGPAYAAAHPQLVRVDEPLMDARWMLYTARAGISMHSLGDLAKLNLEGTWRRGVLACEKILSSVLPRDKLTDVTDTEQGFNLMLAGRTDFYCDVDAALFDEMLKPQHHDAARVHVLWVLDSSPLHTYLNPRHAALAPRLALVLRQMKSEGLLERYQETVLHDIRTHK